MYILFRVIVLLQSSFVGAIAVGDLVKSTLGPKGMVGVILFCQNIRCDCDWWRNSSGLLLLQDKILLSGGKNGSVTVTNDGATILKAIGVDNPAAKVLVGRWHLHIVAHKTSDTVIRTFSSNVLNL